MQKQQQLAQPGGSSWTEGNSSRIPAWVYTDPELYAEELERIFYGKHWSYVGLEAEVPEAGSFKRTSIGERSVIVIRNRRGQINVLENRCAHRGMRFCQERAGKVKTLVCPYHQGPVWTTRSRRARSSTHR